VDLILEATLQTEQHKSQGKTLPSR
jgi:hypothetical protein